MVDGVSLVQRHPTYYFSDGDVCFTVGNTMFRVHKHFFCRESEFFQKLFDEGTNCNGTSSPPQYKLSATVDQFATLCYIWYRREYTYAGIQGKEGWITVLQLATEWKFNEIRKLAIFQLHKVEMEPVERILIYQKYNVNERLLLPAYMVLCRSPTLLFLQAVEKLSVQTILNIVTAREKAILAAPTSGTPGGVQVVSDDSLMQIIKEVFNMTPKPNSKNVQGGGSNENSNVSANPPGDRVNGQSQDGQT